MGIIERAAGIVESIPASYRKGTSEDEAIGSGDLDLIERAVSNNSDHPFDRSTDQQFAREPAPNANPVVGTSGRTVTIDLEKMRQQSIIMPDGERTPIAESFRRIKRHILVNMTNGSAGLGNNLVMITSALPKEGKTFCTVNLAMSLAMELDRTVLLVDADVAKPSITSLLGIDVEGERGLMDVLLDQCLPLADVLCKTSIEKLSVLPAGTPHPHATELLASEAMRVLLKQMAERYPDRLIIFDSPPILAASEASVLASRMGQIVMVVEAGRTTEAALRDALSRIESSNVVGVLLNKGSPPGTGLGGYGYGYGYGYGL